MRSRWIFSIALGLGLGTGAAAAQTTGAFETTQLAEHIYELSIDGGGYMVKVIASVGPDGILLVDSGQTETVEALKAALQTLGHPVPSTIINTHSHVEHTGGNAAFGDAPLIIGHTNLRHKMTHGSFLFDEYPESALPRVTFADSLSLHFNGEEIKLLACPGAHDNCDIVVWFTGSRVACVGALSNGRHFPSVDSDGDVLAYPEIVERLIERLPEDVTVVPGHGEDGTMEDWRAFHAMLVETKDRVQAGLAAGKAESTLVAEDVLKDWEPFECSYVSRARWVHYLVQGLTTSSSARHARREIFEPIYYALRDQGLDAAVALYQEMKTAHAEEYRLGEGPVVIIGYKLYQNHKYREAVRFFALALSEYPAGGYASLCAQLSGDAYRELGDTAQAIQSYRQALEIDPANEDARGALRELGVEVPPAPAPE